MPPPLAPDSPSLARHSLVPPTRWQTPLPGQTSLLHGGDYNPDQWLPEYPDILEVDAELFRRSGLNSATVAVFGWASLQPQRGRFTFDWLDRVMHQQAKLGNRVILATPTGAMPPWLGQAYPECRRVNRQGQREPYGARHNHCWTSKVFREHAAELITAMAHRYKGHPALAMWHISNELNGECYCDLCRDKWASWLEQRYGSVDKLNRQYWAYFWSKQVSDFRQVEPTDWVLDAMMLDWMRFNVDQLIDWYRFEAGLLRPVTPEVPITTNFMGTTFAIDYQRIAREVDVVADDQYPAYDPASPTFFRSAAYVSMKNALYRNFRTRGDGRRTFFLMESCPGAPQWKSPQRLKRPGVHRLEMLQALAEGADGTCYFQFRAGRGAHEKLHGAVVEHGVGLDVEATRFSRTFSAVSALSEAYRRLTPLLGTSVTPEVAIVYDWESKWAQSLSNGTWVPQWRYDDVVVDHYLPFFQRGVPVDVVSPEHDLSSYRLVIVPQMWIVTPMRALALRRFVESGGTLVATFDTGMSDECNRMHIATPTDAGIPGCGLADVLGVRLTDTDRLPADHMLPLKVVDAATSLGEQPAGREVAALVHPIGASVLAEFAGEFYAGGPAITRHAFGAGEAFYVATRLTEGTAQRFFLHLCERLGLQRSLETELPEGVTAHVRGAGDERYVFLLNFSSMQKLVRLPSGTVLAELETGQRFSDSVELTPLAARVFRVE
ncbi:MAG: beta-galactosidase [Tepidisphaerales bacterium]